MFIAENTIDEKVKISISTSYDKPIRSLAKALSWRITGSLDTVMISWFFTSNINTAMAIGLTEVVTKTFLYYFHERAWNRIRIGIH